VSTGVQVLLVVGVVVLNAAVGGDDTHKFDVGAVGARGAAIAHTAQRAEKAVDAQVTIKTLRDAPDGARRAPTTRRSTRLRPAISC